MQRRTRKSFAQAVDQDRDATSSPLPRVEPAHDAARLHDLQRVVCLGRVSIALAILQLIFAAALTVCALLAVLGLLAPLAVLLLSMPLLAIRLIDIFVLQRNMVGHAQNYVLLREREKES